ncbi:hypothetical protein EDD95_1095 [Streptomyces sp. CEV 2-1]|nr:hypothetical protein EDD95_1095 [Streptomyces sp. CEV 2-1]
MTPSSRTTGTTVAEGCRPSHMGCGDQPRLWVVVDAITGWEPGGAARMRARYMHITSPMLRKVAQQVAHALRELPKTD